MNGRLVVALVLGLLIAAGAAGLMFMRDRAGGGPKVAVENPCDAFPSLDGALTAWMQEWRSVQPALTCEHFERRSESRLSVVPAEPWQDAGGELAGLPARWRFDGSDAKVLVPYAVAGGPNEVALIDGRSSTRRVVLRSPTDRWRDAGWMDEVAFVAAGERPGGAPGTTVPILTVVRLDSNVATTYVGPAVPDLELRNLARPEVPGRR